MFLISVILVHHILFPAFSSEGARTHWEAPYGADSWLVFGSEGSGLPAEMRARWAERLYRIPMVAGARSLNLSTAAGIVIYEALRTHGPIRE